jgi:hypothetical protein
LLPAFGFRFLDVKKYIQQTVIFRAPGIGCLEVYRMAGFIADSDDWQTELGPANVKKGFIIRESKD